MTIVSPDEKLHNAVIYYLQWQADQTYIPLGWSIFQVLGSAVTSVNLIE